MYPPRHQELHDTNLGGGFFCNMHEIPLLTPAKFQPPHNHHGSIERKTGRQTAGSNDGEAECVLSDENGNSKTFDAIYNGNDATGEHGNFFGAQDEIPSP
jgi:hypothetical protein